MACIEATGREFLDDDVARQHCADLVLHLQRLERHAGIAGAQDGIRAKVLADLGLQGLLDVDFGEDAEALGGQRGAHIRDRLLKAAVDGLGEVVAHGGSLLDRRGKRLRLRS